MFDPLLVSTIKNIFGKIFSFAKKAFIVIVVYTIIISLFFRFSQQNKETKQFYVDPSEVNRLQLYKTIKESEKSASLSNGLFVWIYRLLYCKSVGELCTDNPNEAVNYKGQSILGGITNLVVAPYANPPASGIYWAYSGLSDANLIPKSYAATDISGDVKSNATSSVVKGFGFVALSPYKNIWLVFRNVALLLMIIVIVAIGFMIMFRSKINPQTIISLENSLPKIVIAMILVTFSYAISGFLIDIMYVLIGIASALFKQIDPVNKADYGTLEFSLKSPINLIRMPPFYIASALLTFLPQTIRSALDGVLTGLFITFLPKIVSALTLGKAFKGVSSIGQLSKVSELANKSQAMQKLGAMIIKLFNSKATAEQLANSGQLGVSIVFAILSIILGILVEWFITPVASAIILGLVILFSMAFLYFRILFMLVYAYINVLLLFFFSPFIILLEAIPGKSTFSSWLKNMLLSLSTFPIMVVLVFLSRFLMMQGGSVDASTSFIWHPPFLSAIEPWAFNTIIAGALLFMAPDLISSFKKMTGVKPLGLDLNIGAFFQGGQATLGSGVGMLGQFSSINLGLSALGVSGGLRGGLGSLTKILGGRPAHEASEALGSKSGQN